MAATVRIELGEWELSFRKALKALSAKDSLLKRAFMVVGIRDINQHFRDEAGPEGSWRPWSEAYRRRRLGISQRLASSASRRRARAAGRALGPGKILQLTGNLRKSTLAPDVRQVSGDTIKVVSPPGYGGYHDEGTRRLPKREFMWMSDRATGDMAKTVLEAVAEGF